MLHDKEAYILYVHMKIAAKPLTLLVCFIFYDVYAEPCIYNSK